MTGVNNLCSYVGKYFDSTISVLRNWPEFFWAATPQTTLRKTSDKVAELWNHYKSYIYWDTIKSITSYLGSACTKFVAIRSFCYWPEFYWFTGMIGTQRAYKVRKFTESVIDIWSHNKLHTLALLTISSVFTFPPTALFVATVFGCHTGSNLAIETATHKAISVYNKSFTEPQKKALFEFLFADRNLLTFNSLHHILAKIKLLKEKANSPIHREFKREFSQLLVRERQKATAKILKIQLLIKDPIMNEVFNNFVLLNP